MNRTTGILASALVVQLAVIGMRATGAGSGAASGAAADGAPLFPGLTAAQVAKVSIRDAAGTAIELARGPSGDWAVASAAGYPAKPDAVQRAIDKVLGAKSLAVAASSPRSHVGLEVTDEKAQRDVRFAGSDGKDLLRLLVGRSVAGGNFVRKAGENDVHRTSESIAIDLSTAPATYIDTQLISFEPNDIEALTITRGGAPIELAKEGEKWVMRKPIELDVERAKVEEVLRSASRVYFQKPVAPKAAKEHGLDLPALVVEVKAKGGATHKLDIGSKSPGGNARYARKAGSDFVLELAEYTFTSLDKDAEFFRPPPPPQAPVAPGVPGAAPAPGAPPAELPVAPPGAVPAPGAGKE